MTARALLARILDGWDAGRDNDDILTPDAVHEIREALARAAALEARVAALTAESDALTVWLIDHCDEPVPQVWIDEDAETGDAWLWCEGHQQRGPRIARFEDAPAAEGDLA